METIFELKDLNAVIPGAGTALEFLSGLSSPDASQNWTGGNWPHYFQYDMSTNYNPCLNWIPFFARNPDFLRNQPWDTVAGSGVPMPLADRIDWIRRKVRAADVTYPGKGLESKFDLLLQQYGYVQKPVSTQIMDKVKQATKTTQAGITNIILTVLIIGAAIWAAVVAFGKKGSRKLYGVLVPISFVVTMHGQVSNNGVKQLQSDWSAVSGVTSIRNKPKVPLLDTLGKIKLQYIPSLGLADTMYIRASRAALTGITGGKLGDFALTTDSAKTFVLAGNDPGNINNWIWLRPFANETDPVYMAERSGYVPYFGAVQDVYTNYGINASYFRASSFGVGNIGELHKMDSIGVGLNIAAGTAKTDKYALRVAAYDNTDIALYYKNRIIYKQPLSLTSVIADIVVKNGGVSNEALIADGSIRHLEDGVYSPSYSNVTGFSNFDNQSAMWYRIGETVYVEGHVFADVTANGVITFTISLPVSSSLSATQLLKGQATMVGSQTGYVVNYSSNNAHVVFNNGVSGTSQHIFYHFTYRVI